MPTISATFTPSPRMALQSYRAINRERIIVRWTSAAVVAVLGVVLQLWPLLVLAIAFPLISELIIRRQLKPFQAENRPVGVTINDESLELKGPDQTISYAWSELTTVRRRGEQWVLRPATTPATSFPASALTPEQTAAFSELLRSRGLLPT